MTQNLPILVYSAPELAAVETAQYFTTAADISLNLLIEPGLARYFSSDEPTPHLLCTKNLLKNLLLSIKNLFSR